MAKTVIDLDEEALALAAEALGTKTKKDTVNAALAEIGARVRRERALARLLALDEEGAFDKGREPGFKEEVRGSWGTSASDT
ncbi:type II toxin-antitoxin system VapB family antitoxin [Streptomyces sp. NPDC089799]|uniref:type II toxin-antitoxin system VapB family antitoxin n=1 Tax=Streptomyces sp. NPDC089799 TaxID=3155066 RepID=UPI0034316A5B